MAVSSPSTTSTFENLRLLIFASKPANPAAVTLAAATAAVPAQMHVSGEWWPEGTTESVTRSRKMGKGSTVPGKGVTNHTLPELLYTYKPQLVGTPGSDGNEVYEALAEGSTPWVMHVIGKSSKGDPATGDVYRLFPLVPGYQFPTQTQDDAGAEAAIRQAVFFQEGYDGPIHGVIVAGS